MNVFHPSDPRIQVPVEHAIVFGNMPSSVFYKMPEWKKARYHALKMYGNRCHLCGAGPQLGIQLHVDHIKPRHLYPDLCLDFNNLQILCNTCHSAKGAWHEDDCRGKHTVVDPIRLKDFFRITKKHTILDIRVLRGRQDIEYISEGVRAPSKRYRTRWRLLVSFCAKQKLLYSEAIRLTVADFMTMKCSKDQKMEKFTSWGSDGKKRDGDILFDIAGCLFPESIYELLADDQL